MIALCPGAAGDLAWMQWWSGNGWGHLCARCWHRTRWVTASKVFNERSPHQLLTEHNVCVGRICISLVEVSIMLTILFSSFLVRVYSLAVSEPHHGRRRRTQEAKPMEIPMALGSCGLARDKPDVASCGSLCLCFPCDSTNRICCTHCSFTVVVS
jgi:hypothetical protein